MKSKIMLIAVVVALSLGLLGCAPAAKQASVEVPLDDFSKQHFISREVTVNAGDSFTLTLGSNPTMGFTWPDEPQISDQTVLQQTAHEFIPPGEEGVVGAPSKEVWTFKALNKGNSTISMVSGIRIGCCSSKSGLVFALTVVVK